MSELPIRDDAIERDSLSRTGRARRDVMLGQLQDAMRAHHRRRRMRNAAFSAIGVVLIVGVVIRLLDSPAGSPPLESPPVKQIMLVEFVRTQPDIVERYRAQPPSLIQRIPNNDASLAQALHDIGRPTGLIRIGGRLQFSDLKIDEPAVQLTPSET